NSIQSIEGEGKITISIKEESNYLNIYFEDSGSGIAEENINEIFEPLFTTKVTGTGLGLGICKNIIDEHGGKISVHNNPTTFIIKLPKKV
ncbi:MAG: HAMP domain-containing sensor histidine kinase, partial [Nitrosopumilus sp.]